MLSLAATPLLAMVRCVKRGGVIINEHVLSRKQTRFHVEVLGRWFDFIKLADLPVRLASPGRKPFCLLTFDDGKLSNFTEVAPELERLGVSAVFYLTTEAVTTGRPVWFDRHRQLIQAIGHCPPELELPALKQLPFDLLTERLDRACVKFNFAPSNRSDDLRPMSWEQARSLYARGFDIGAHGVTHAILIRETRKRAIAEIRDSLAKVSLELGAPCQTFAFPNGNYDGELTEFAWRCGARTIMTTNPSWVDQSCSLQMLPRIQLFGEALRARIELKISLAASRGALPNPNGTPRLRDSSATNETIFSSHLASGATPRKRDIPAGRAS